MPSPAPIPDHHQTMYSLNCTVCQNDYVNNTEWLKHLTDDEHQNLARKQFLLNWNTTSVKECCVVMFSSCPLTSEAVYERLESFSNQTGNFLVTDFLRWEDRPQIVILQFESSGKARQLLNALKYDTHFDMGNLTGINVHLEGAIDLVEPIWSAILPPARVSGEEGDETLTAEFSLMKVAQVPTPTVSSRKHLCDSSSEQNTFPAKKRRIVNNSITNSANVDVEPLQIPMLLSDQLPATITSISHPLQHQFWYIRKSVIIPNTEYEVATSAIKSLEMIFRKTFPKSEVVVLSNLWNLKVRDQNCDTEYNQLLLHLRNCYRKSTDGKTRVVTTAFKASQMRQVSSDPAVQEEFRLVKEKSTIQKWKVTFKSTNIDMFVINGKEFLMQIQVRRLTEYLLSFDPRCQPLLTLILFWTNANSANFGGTEVTNLEKTHSGYLPALLTIKWLLIHYLCNRKKKYIPTPFEILSRPHEILEDCKTGTDIGFNADLNFVEEWKSERTKVEESPEDLSSDAFILSVIKPFRDFLHCCYFKLGRQNGNSWIFNSQTGISITVDNYLKKLKVLMPTGSQPKSKLHMTHPFLLDCKFPISNDITRLVELFKVTGTKLDRFLQFMKTFVLSSAVRRCGTLENVLTIDRSIRDNLLNLIERTD